MNELHIYRLYLVLLNMCHVYMYIYSVSDGLYTYSYRWKIPLTYTLSNNPQWTNPQLEWMAMTDSNYYYY